MNYRISISYDVVVDEDNIEKAEKRMYDINDEVMGLLSYWYDAECTGLTVEVEE